MAEGFLSLSASDRREALEVASSASGRPAHLLEKDVWVVWSLAALFDAPFAEHLVFKGGTSLSKGYGAIQRFSEDVDLTYNIGALIPDIVGTATDHLPSNPSQTKAWRQAIQERLPRWVSGTVAPLLRETLKCDGLAAAIRVAGDKLLVDYPPLVTGSGYVSPSVLLEFGARGTGEPAEQRTIVCDAAEHLSTLAFPEAKPRIMRVERTFWEKATAAHVYCVQGRLRGDRFARHWHDLVRLDEAGYADRALSDRELAMAVARHKSKFFPEKDANGASIDYEAAVLGDLVLVPTGTGFEALERDYERMVEGGLLWNDPDTFAVLMERCMKIAERVKKRP